MCRDGRSEGNDCWENDCWEDDRDESLCRVSNVDGGTLMDVVDRPLSLLARLLVDLRRIPERPMFERDIDMLDVSDVVDALLGERKLGGRGGRGGASVGREWTRLEGDPTEDDRFLRSRSRSSSAAI